MCQNNATNPSTPLQSLTPPMRTHSLLVFFPSSVPTRRSVTRGGGRLRMSVTGQHYFFFSQQTKRHQRNERVAASLHHRWRSTGLVSAPELPPVPDLCVFGLPAGYAGSRTHIFFFLSEFISYAREPRNPRWNSSSRQKLRLKVGEWMAERLLVQLELHVHRAHYLRCVLLTQTCVFNESRQVFFSTLQRIMLSAFFFGTRGVKNIGIEKKN
jgi:hypothetical protein